jgi:hypothetical protein
MLKTAFAAALMSAAIAAPAFAAPADKADLGGVYAGGEIGYGKINNSLDFTPKTGALGGGKASKSGFEWGGFVGYGTVVGGGVYLGAEANLGGGGAKAARVLGAQKLAVDPGLRYGMAARAGVALGDSGLLYGKVGLERRRLEVSELGAKKNLTQRGVRYGLGYEQRVASGMGLRLELTRVNYDDRKASFSSGDQVKLDSKETRATVGAVVNF